MKHLYKTISDIFFIVGIAIAGLVLVNKLLGPRGFSPFIVSSGSMVPSLPVGSVAFVLPQDSYTQGDIITFHPPNQDKLTVTHRIQFKTFPNNSTEPVFITSGDANTDLDTFEVRQQDIVGQVLFSVPYLGFVADFAKTPKGFIFLVIVPATIVIYEEIKSLLAKLNSTKSTVPNIKPNSALMLIPILLASVVAFSATHAFLSDHALSLTNILSVATDFVP